MSRDDRGYRGDGKLVRYLRSTHPELNVIERAIKGGWAISEDKRAEVIENLMDMVRGPNRSLAVKAARILKDAVADDRRHELGILLLLERDQADSLLPFGGTVDAQAVSQLEEMGTEDLHAFMEKVSQPPQITSEEQED
jgi:hypothetical protein